MSRLAIGFRLPHPITAVEDNGSCVLLIDPRPGQKGLAEQRLFIDCVPLHADEESYNDTPLFVASLRASSQWQPAGMVKRWIFGSLPELSPLGIGERRSAILFKLPDLLVRFAIELIAEPLEEQQRENVGHVVLPGGSATQDVGSAPQMRLKLLLRQFR